MDVNLGGPARPVPVQDAAGSSDLLTAGRAASVRRETVSQHIEDDVLVVTAVMPLLDPRQDIEVGIQPGLLRIFATRRDPEPWEPWTGDPERPSAEVFAHVLALPTRAIGDEATARYASGILSIRVPLAPTTPPRGMVTGGAATT